MNDDDIKPLLREFDGRTEQPHEHRSTGPPTSGDSDRTDRPASGGVGLERSFASQYLDELIIAILFRCEEANGMDIIREFTHLFGVQFSPGTVYPHLHSLEEEGVLERRERVRTKEYRIDDEQAARENLASAVSQLSCLGTFLSTARNDSEDADGEQRRPEGKGTFDTEA